MRSVTMATKTTTVPKGRDMFASKLGVIVATLGSAIGLGNIWKFPYLTGVNGGAAFVIIYILCTLVVGLPVMIRALPRKVTVAYLVESHGWSRKKATWATLVALVLVGSLAALSGSLTANIKVMGMTFFDLFDWSTSNVLLPLGGLFLCLFVGWRWGSANIKAALTNEGSLRNEAVASVFTGVVKVITPALVLIILLAGLKII